jgi:hypothetical protein
MPKQIYYFFAELSQVGAWAMLIFVLLELIKPRLVLAQLNLTGFFIFWLITAIISLVLKRLSSEIKK